MMTQLQKQPRLLSSMTNAYIRDNEHKTHISTPDCEEWIFCLLKLGQLLCGQTQGVVDQLSQEVTNITQGYARLFLHRFHFSARKEQHPFTVLLSLPVEFSGLSYGTLEIAPDPEKLLVPALSLDTAHLLAQICGWLLYTFEQAAFVRGRFNQTEHSVYIRLTNREQEILKLIGHGYNRESIAGMLNITPATVDKHRQHIYEQLGVHCERDAILVAYVSGLFSPIEEVRICDH